jgi:hypothetical protein
MKNITLKQISDSLDKLAVSVKNGFEFVESKFFHLEKRMAHLEQGQEAILERLDQHAWKMDFNNLKYRVDKIEKKIGME